VKGHDLTDVLRSWPPEPGQINVRAFEGADGRRKVQVRVELGILQMEAEGRPDGTRPNDQESLLHDQRRRLDRYMRQAGTDIGFVLSPEDCRALREEAVQYYHRYVALFALGDFDGVVRDTQRNLDVFDLCRQYAANDDDKAILEQLRPAVIAMRTRAEAEMAIGQKLPKQALFAIDSGLAEIRDAFEETGRADQYERSNEVQLLRGMRDALVPKLPSSQRVELQERLQAAIDAENYELAAILRDELRLLGP
jgi:hypothetical protein